MNLERRLRTPLRFKRLARAVLLLIAGMGCAGFRLVTTYRSVQERNPNWPADLTKLASQPTFVSGAIVECTDILYYRGTADDLTSFLAGFSALNSADSKVVILHAGFGQVLSPSPAVQRTTGTAAVTTQTVHPDWEMDVETIGTPGYLPHREVPQTGPGTLKLRATPSTTGFIYKASVHVWTGSGLDWKKVNVPKGMNLIDTRHPATTTTLTSSGAVTP